MPTYFEHAPLAEPPTLSCSIVSFMSTLYSSIMFWKQTMNIASKYGAYYSGPCCFLWIYEDVTKLTNQLHTSSHFYTSFTIS